MTEAIDPTPAPEPDNVKIGDKCPKCDGTGKIFADGKVAEPCWQCKGDGRADEGDPIVTKSKDEVPRKNAGEELYIEFGGLEYTYFPSGNAFVNLQSSVYYPVKDKEQFDKGNFIMCKNGICQSIPIKKRIVIKVQVNDSTGDKKS